MICCAIKMMGHTVVCLHMMVNPLAVVLNVSEERKILCSLFLLHMKSIPWCDD